MGVFDLKQQTQETDEQKQQRINNLVNSTQDKLLLETPDLYKKSDNPSDNSNLYNKPVLLTIALSMSKRVMFGRIYSTPTKIN